MTFHVLNLLAVSLDIPNLFQPKSRGAAQAKTTITRRAAAVTAAATAAF